MFAEATRHTEERCARFLERLQKDRFFETRPLLATFRNTHEECPWSHRLDEPLLPIQEGTTWGQHWESAWFYINTPIPNEWPREELALAINLTGEALIFDCEGHALYATTGNSVFNESYSKDLFLPPSSIIVDDNKGEQHLQFYIEAASNSLFGLNLITDPHRAESYDVGGHRPAVVQTLRMGRLNKEAFALRFDFEVLWDLYTVTQKPSARARQLLAILTRAVNAYADDPRNATAARAVLAPELARPACSSALEVTAIGHAHIDVAWLWPIRESKRKAVRTFASQIELIKRYPDYVFGASQACLYAFVEERAPEVFAAIQQAVKEGRWEIQGGTWVEPDCNVPCGESLIRQFLVGKSYFKEKFGVTPKGLWLPDVFGYNGNLPQIIKKSGCDWFLTQKLSWNPFNKMPHNSFRWRGIDGSEVVAHFPPENDYNAFATPRQLVPASDRYPDSAEAPRFLSLFGLGDGGGGPSECHIERLMRMRNLEGLPKITPAPAQAFFNDLLKDAPALATWEGELYFETHRGTYTNQARTKKLNRTLELLLQNTETLYACGDLKSYPKAEFDTLWKVLLTHQFHDILPGSCIREQYESTERELTEAIDRCRKLQLRAAKMLNATRKPMIHTAARGEAKDLTLENETLRATFNEQGQLISLWDKTHQRESLAAPSNILSLYVNRPNDYEGWDMDPFYREEPQTFPREVSIKALKDTIAIEAKIGDSIIYQHITFSSAYGLQFETMVDWHERRQLLRVAFTPESDANEVKCAAPYGYVMRPLHENTSWQKAQMEFCAQREVSLKDAEHSFTLMSDSKYGFRAKRGDLSMSLLRSACYPDPRAEEGRHIFTYLISIGDENEDRESLDRQLAPLYHVPQALKPIQAISNEGNGNVQLDLLKRSENHEDVIVARLHETSGNRTKVSLYFTEAITAVETTNLCEEGTIERWEIDPITHALTLPFGAFEIKTLRLIR